MRRIPPFRAAPEPESLELISCSGILLALSLTDPAQVSKPLTHKAIAALQHRVGIEMERQTLATGKVPAHRDVVLQVADEARFEADAVRHGLDGALERLLARLTGAAAS